MRTKHHYEVIGWDDADKSNEAYHANCTSKCEAMRIAKSLRGIYDLLTVDRVTTNADDPNDYIGFEAIATFTK